MRKSKTQNFIQSQKTQNQYFQLGLLTKHGRSQEGYVLWAANFPLSASAEHFLVSFLKSLSFRISFSISFGQLVVRPGLLKSAVAGPMKSPSMAYVVVVFKGSIMFINVQGDFYSIKPFKKH